MSGNTIDRTAYMYYGNNLYPTVVEKTAHDNEDKHEIHYTYDANGNITSSCECSMTESAEQNYDSPTTEYDTVEYNRHVYTYDSLNRITSDEYDSGKAVYTYDTAGNITTKTVYNKDYVGVGSFNYVLDKKYTYVYNVNGWKDQLSRIEISGEAPCDSGNCNCNCNCVNTLTEYFSYNTLGYPTVYRGKYLTWDRVNRLTRFNGNTFTYDSAGMRLTKNTNTQYTYDGDKLIREVRNGKVIEYIYGLSGIIGFVYNGTPYYYVKDIQGNVKRITNINGHVVASYSYDAWGNHTVYDEYGDVNTYQGIIGNINPIRYRSYYYDSETGLYYLQNRYYDPEIGRFISPDSTKYLAPESINGLNLYAYCLNNPVMYEDPRGNLPFFIFTMLIGAFVGFGITTAVDYSDDGKAFNDSVHWGWYLGATLLGAAVGAGIGMGVSYYATGKITSPAGKVFSGLFGKTYYRTMSTDDYAYLQETGKIRWSGGNSETFITKSSKYAKNNYSGVTVRFRVNRGTLNSLKQIGVRNKSLLTAKKYPNMALVKKGWMPTNAFFKAENGIINIGLGYGQALDIFNSGIIWFSIV